MAFIPCRLTSGSTRTIPDVQSRPVTPTSRKLDLGALAAAALASFSSDIIYVTPYVNGLAVIVSAMAAGTGAACAVVTPGVDVRL